MYFLRDKILQQVLLFEGNFRRTKYTAKIQQTACTAQKTMLHCYYVGM